MYHHGQGTYAEAASKAAAQGRIKMEEIIAKGQNNAMEVLNQVNTQVPNDVIVNSGQLFVSPNEVGEGFALTTRNNSAFGVKSLHENALSQIAEKTGFYNKYLNDLRKMNPQQKREGDEPWANELIAYNLNTLLSHSNERHLIRSVGAEKEEIRGFLSDRFRRLDSRPLLDAFMGGCKSIGAVPVDGYALDTRVRMRAVLPVVFEPVDNEVMLFGIQWGNSDFGNGGHCLSLFNIRVWCTNTAITDEVLRQVHIGKKLEDNIIYSKKTLELDTRTNVSALQDIINHVLSPNAVNGYLEHIRFAAEEQIDHRDVTRILKEKLTKAEAAGVEGLFDGPDVLNLPPGNTTYRLSNAISFFAQGEKVSRARRLDLEQIAGSLVGVYNDKIKQV